MPQSALDLQPVGSGPPQLLPGRPGSLDLQPLDLQPTGGDPESLLHKIFVFPAKGITETIPQGFNEMIQPGFDAKAQGLSTMLGGVMQAATPFAVPAIAAAGPLSMALGTGAGVVGGGLGDIGARVLGAPPGVANLTGQLLGLAAGTGTGKFINGIAEKIPASALFKAALRNLPYLKSVYRDPLIQELLNASAGPAASSVESPYFAGSATGEPSAIGPVLKAPPGYQPPISGALPGTEIPAAAEAPAGPSQELLDQISGQLARKKFAKLSEAEKQTVLNVASKVTAPSLKPPPGISTESPVNTEQVPVSRGNAQPFASHEAQYTDLKKQWHATWPGMAMRKTVGQVYGLQPGTMPTYDQTLAVHEWMLNHNGKIPGPGDLK